mmetsp:Transcript_5143/g.5989  ORF Transcript_5143/g.5989 Transcript_5143/m.5989 type:complete len:229 (-) Transcript_5143:294-980(-)
MSSTIGNLFLRFLLLLILCGAFFIWSNTTEECKHKGCLNPDQAHVISAEELVSKTGQDDVPIWSSLLGQVYDVTSGLFKWSNSAEECKHEDCLKANQARVISAEELASKTGKDDGPIWLSLLGQVYDVTSGRDFYGPDRSYNFFAGKDASPTFFTGEFNDEGLKADMRSFSPKELLSLEGWIKFYVEHDRYNYVALLKGDYYDAKGNPTSLLNEITQKIASVNERQEL